jgi:hypothetical protein
MAKERLRSDNDTWARRSHVFTEGDKVWLDAKNIKVHQPLKKLGPKRLGPFTVVKRVGDLDYQLALPPSLKLHNVFHVNCLSPWKGNEVNGELPLPPGPIEIDDEEEEYEVEAILDLRFFRQQLQYLVQWKRYDTGHNMWILWFNVNSEELVNAFHHHNPNAPHRLAAALFLSLPWTTVENATIASTDLEWETGRHPGTDLSGTTSQRRGIMSQEQPLGP